MHTVTAEMHTVTAKLAHSNRNFDLPARGADRPTRSVGNLGRGSSVGFCGAAALGIPAALTDCDWRERRTLQERSLRHALFVDLRRYETSTEQDVSQIVTSL